jgi:ubiquinone/menaquinone biosynthesis C-methylase UbiE
LAGTEAGVTHAIEVEPHKDDYAMGRTPAEYERLRQQARILEPAARRVLEQIGLASGMCCVDIGCGPGEVMRLMGELVGPSGRVVGIDVDSTLGAQALAMLRERGTGRFEFVEADAAQLDQLPGGECDLAYARLVLIHTQDPAVLLRRMYGWLRPGGYLVVQDFDLKGMDADAAGEAGREFLRVAIGVFQALGRDPQTGQNLPYYFRAAGLGRPDGTDISGILSPMTTLAPMMEGVFRSVLPHALRLGLTTEARSEVLLAGLTGLAERDEIWGRWPLLMSAWKRKPLETSA